MQEVANLLPEVLNGLADILPDITPLAFIIRILAVHAFKLCLCTLGSLLATELGNHLLGNIILIRQVGIHLLNKLPGICVDFHQSYDVLPAIGVQPAECLTPRMGKLMDRQLCINLRRIEIHLALIGETIDLAVWCLEVTKLTLFALVFLGLLPDSAHFTSVSSHIKSHLLQLVYHRSTNLLLVDTVCHLCFFDADSLFNGINICGGLTDIVLKGVLLITARLNIDSAKKYS